MKKVFKRWPYFVCILTPLLGITVNNAFNFRNDWYSILGFWITSSIILFIIYLILNILVNESLTSKKTIIFTIGLLSSCTLVSLISIKNFNPMRADSTINYPAILVVRYLFAGSILWGGLLLVKYTEDRETVILKNSALQLENVNAQLHLLRNQVNPHFLFNSLSTLLSMIRNKEVQSEEYVLKLAAVYRQILENRASSKISLKEELQFLDAYIFLLKVNHGNRINIKIAIKEESLQYNLPAFALQLLVENCIKHNITSEAHPLKISIYNIDTKRIAVSNNYQPKIHKEESFGLGISYLFSSYKLLEIKGGVEIEKNEEHYKTFLKLI